MLAFPQMCPCSHAVSCTLNRVQTVLTQFLLQSHFVFGVSPGVFGSPPHLVFCIPIVFAFASFHFSSRHCLSDTLHFTALILALAMALDDQTGTVPDSQPLLGLLRPVCTVKRFANRAARTAPYLAFCTFVILPTNTEGPWSSNTTVVV